MVKQDIINQVAENARMSEYEARIAVEATIKVIKEAFERGEDIYIRGFGTFKIKTRAPKSVRDINNGQQYTIASRKRVVFKQSEQLLIK